MSYELPPDPIPQGFLVAVGGNEDKQWDLKVLRGILDLVEDPTGIVEVIPTASRYPKEVGQTYIEAFSKAGAKQVNVMDIQERDDAQNHEYVDRILAADVVFLTGGDQLRLTNILGGSPVLDTIKGHYRRGGVVAGTSAGAAAMPAAMIFGGEAGDAMHKGTVNMTAGLGLIRNVVVDSHFIHRGRFSRLLEIVSGSPGHIGIGLGEDAGVIVRQGQMLEALGNGIVVLLDAHDMTYTNVTQIKMKQPIAVENVVVHTLTAGHGYDLKARQYIRGQPPREALNDEDS